VDSVPTLKEFQAKHRLSLTLLSDFKRGISRSYGVLIPERFYSNRAYFLIDRTGRIAWMHVEDSPGNKRTNQELLEQIAAHS
jgi:peroxiredoxin